MRNKEEVNKRSMKLKTGEVGIKGKIKGYVLKS